MSQQPSASYFTVPREWIDQTVVLKLFPPIPGPQGLNFGMIDATLLDIDEHGVRVRLAQGGEETYPYRCLYSVVLPGRVALR